MRPAISIIIPVYQEGDAINRIIRHIRSIQGGLSCEIIVVDGHPEGSTLSAIEEGNVMRIGAAKGRGRQMNAGAQAASGDVLLFLHADTRLPTEALSRIRSILEEGSQVGGAFSLRIDSGRFFFRILERLTALRVRFTRVPYGDQGIFIRSRYFREIGGYRDIPILEDVELMRRIRKRGDRIALLQEPVLTSPRRWDEKGLIRTTLRNRIIMILYNLGIKSEHLFRLYS